MFSTAVFDNQKIIPSALFLLFSLRISLITREREREREREIKVTSKRLEEGQVQKIKKDFEMTQCPTVFTLSMTRANTLSMEQ